MIVCSNHLVQSNEYILRDIYYSGNTVLKTKTPHIFLYLHNYLFYNMTAGSATAKVFNAISA